jgi:transposase
MASRYDESTKARAVRLVREHAGDYETEWAAMKAISARFGHERRDVTQMGAPG